MSARSLSARQDDTYYLLAGLGCILAFLEDYFLLAIGIREQFSDLFLISYALCWFSFFDTDFRNTISQHARKFWLNLLQMTVMMLGVVLVGNTNAVFHYSTHMEVALMNDDVDEALRVGNRSLETNERLTMLRAYALSKKGKLADGLFGYPVKGTSETLLPMQLKPQLLPEDSIWKHLGARCAKTVNSEFYYERMERDTLGTSAMADYRLCGYLMNRDLNSFVRVLPRYYEVSDSVVLPRHYKEALVLYQHLTAHPLIVYHDAVLAEDWNNLQQLKVKYSKEPERRYRIFDNYQKSYWYYYYYRN